MYLYGECCSRGYNVSKYHNLVTGDANIAHTNSEYVECSINKTHTINAEFEEQIQKACDVMYKVIIASLNHELETYDLLKSDSVNPFPTLPLAI